MWHKGAYRLSLGHTPVGGCSKFGRCPYSHTHKDEIGQSDAMNSVKDYWEESRAEVRRIFFGLSESGSACCPKCFAIYPGSNDNRPPCPNGCDEKDEKDEN